MRGDEMGVDDQARIDQRGPDPPDQRGVPTVVRRARRERADVLAKPALHDPVHALDPAGRSQGARVIGERERRHRVERAPQPTERIAPEVRMFRDAGGDERMCDLE